MDTKWLAICSNGAIALGAYEAGVLAQIYADVFEVNRSGPAVGIDVIAGASAGAVTGTLLAQAVVAKVDPAVFTGRLGQTWITGLSAGFLLGDTTNPAESIFDPSPLNNLAEEVLLHDDAMKAACAEIGSPPVVLSIALTNIDGIPYRITMQNGAEVIAGLYADYETLLIEDGLPSILPGADALAKAVPDKGPKVSWSVVQAEAITSGAFPFAFKSQVLKRDLSQYSGAVLPADGATKVNFNYVDGGVLNNDPVGRAIDGATFQEKLFGHSNHQRTFLVIEPDPTTVEQAQTALASIAEDENGVPFPTLGAHIIGAYFNDALYRDLKNAVDTNKQIEALDSVLNPLVTAGTITSEQATDIRKAVKLDFKKRIDIERVPSAPRSFKLAGAFQGHFGGFFKQEYRESDFAVGCYEARQWFIDWTARQEIVIASPLPETLQSGGPAGVQPRLPPKGGYDGIGEPAFGDIKDKIANRSEDLAKHAIQSSGLWGILEAPLFALGRRIVRSELDHVMVDPKPPGTDTKS